MFTSRNRVRGLTLVAVVIFTLLVFSLHPGYLNGTTKLPISSASRSTLSNHLKCSDSPIYGEGVYPGPQVERWESSSILKGGPTKKYRENLRDDVNLITSWTSGSFTNQFIGYVNMIYLGLLSNRVPVLPPFVPERPANIAFGDAALPFGYAFNMTHARQAIGQPLLEWAEVKHVPDPMGTTAQLASTREPIGCWSTEHATALNALHAVINNLGFDVGFTRLPLDAQTPPGKGEDAILNFGRTVPYIDPEQPIRQPNSFALMQPTLLGHRLTPDEQLTCIDSLHLATSSGELDEWKYAWAPAWRFVGRHLRFMHNDIELAKSYLSRAFKVPEGDIPPFIVIGLSQRLPISELRQQVEQVRADLKLKKNVDATQIIVILAREDPQFWVSVEDLGWARLDHFKEMTLEKYGHWAKNILDEVIASMGVGLVGEAESTFGLVSARRVHDWNGGVVRFLS